MLFVRACVTFQPQEQSTTDNTSRVLQFAFDYPSERNLRNASQALGVFDFDGTQSQMVSIYCSGVAGVEFVWASTFVPLE